MTPSRADVNRLLELLSRGWDQQRTEEDNAEIEQIVRKHGELGGRLVLELSSMHVELGRLVASNNVYEQVMQRIEGSVSDSSARRVLPAGRSPFAKPRSSSMRTWLPWAAAASMLLSAGYAVTNRAPRAGRVAEPTRRIAQLVRPSQPVANLASGSNAVWGKGLKLAAGQQLLEDQQLTLLSGSAQLSMVCGADLVMQAPCVITLTADDYVTLQEGTLTARAAEWATGFVVEANELQLTDLGTQFAVSADRSGVVEAHVIEGEVLAEPMKARRPRRTSLLLKTGQGIRVDGARSQVDILDAGQRSFAQEIESFNPLRPVVTLWNTGVGLQVGSQDLRWRVTRGVDAFGPYPRPATVTDGDTGSYKDNKPEISQWISVSGESYPGVPPESTFTFETSFDLTGYDINTIYIVGHFLVDDAINELRINGKPVEFERWVTTWDEYDFQSFHPIPIVDGFVEGENTISIDVYNSPSNPKTPANPNPIGLRVEWQAYGCTVAQ